jgi:hypothetical protein
VAIQYFSSTPEVYNFIGADYIEKWASLGEEIAVKSRKAAEEYFRVSPDVVKRIGFKEIERWVRLGIKIIERSPKIKANYGAHSLFAQGTKAGKSQVIELAVQYFKSAPQIIDRLSIRDLEDWIEDGLKAADRQKEKSEAYFALMTGKSRKAMEGRVKGVELRQIYNILHNYAKAITDRRVILKSSDLLYKNLPGLGQFLSTTDGVRVFLPSRVTFFEDGHLNFKAYKWILSHELAHILFGTYTLDKGYFEFFRNKDAFKLFEFLEDERVDYLMCKTFPGLEKDRKEIIHSYYETHHYSVNEPCIFEILGRISFTGESINFMTNEEYKILIEFIKRVRKDDCSVEDVFNISKTLYEQGGKEIINKICKTNHIHRRLFYRGLVDFELYEKSRAGISALIKYIADRCSIQRDSEEDIKEALYRVEEAEGLESNKIIWQVDDKKDLEDIFDRVIEVLNEIEEEKACRRIVYYDEWDRNIEDYKKEWCRVREIRTNSTDLTFYEDTVREYYGLVTLLKRYFGLMRPDRFRRYFREEKGDEFDLDALIESVVDRHAGVTPSDKVYIRRDKKLRDVSVAFLIDMSFSTGEKLPTGKKIIDIEKQGLILMAEALESIGDNWAIYGFSTNYRDKIDFHIIKDFRETFNEEVKMRFENIQPQSQTRLGAVIRHAVSLLEKEESFIRMLILISDGRPYDIDYGDLDYAVEDTRMALWEGRQKGISSFCITVDKKSREYLPYMYGESNYIIIDNIDSLPTSLPLIYKKLTT